MDYRTVVKELWRHHDLSDARRDYTNLVRYATLAASSHNTQPWRFHLESGRIVVLPDLSRRCPQVDPDDHHLWASLGCATANLLEAAAAAGLQGSYALNDTGSNVVVELEEGRASRSALFEAIPLRQCTRTEYDGSAATADEHRLLEAAGTGRGVSILLLTALEKKRSIADYVIEGNLAQMADSGWVDELKAWIRLNGRHATSTGDGLYGRAMGSPDVPSWLGRLILNIALNPKSQNRKDVKNIQSSAGVAVFISEVDDKAHWVEAGRCYERFALQAAALDLRTAFINPPVEVPSLRSEFASWLGVGNHRPSLLVRYGRGPTMPRSLRRPIEQVLV